MSPTVPKNAHWFGHHYKTIMIDKWVLTPLVVYVCMYVHSNIHFKAWAKHQQPICLNNTVWSVDYFILELIQLYIQCRNSLIQMQFSVSDIGKMCFFKLLVLSEKKSQQSWYTKEGKSRLHWLGLQFSCHITRRDEYCQILQRQKKKIRTLTAAGLMTSISFLWLYRFTDKHPVDAYNLCTVPRG